MVNILLTKNITCPIKFTMFINKLAEKIQSISNRPGGFEVVLEHVIFFLAKPSFIRDYLFLFSFE